MVGQSWSRQHWFVNKRELPNTTRDRESITARRIDRKSCMQCLTQSEWYDWDVADRRWNRVQAGKHTPRDQETRNRARYDINCMGFISWSHRQWIAAIYSEENVVNTIERDLSSSFSEPIFSSMRCGQHSIVANFSTSRKYIH